MKQGLLALAVTALLVAPLLLPGSYYDFLLILVFIYAIVSIGMNVLVGYAGQFSLGHAGLMAIGAYVSAFVSMGLQDYPALSASGLHVWIGMVAGTLAAGVAGAALALPALRLAGPYLAMVTIAFGWIVWKTLLSWSSVTGGDLGVTDIPRPRIGGFFFGVTQYYYLAALLMLLAFLMQRNLVVSAFGRKLQALKHSEIAAAAVGVDPYREKVTVFVISALFAGAGGALFAHLQNFINPDDFQFVNSIFFLLTIMFGGAGTMIGPLIGAAFLTLVPEALQDAERFRLIIFAVLILATLFFLPRGVAGLFVRARRVVPTESRAQTSGPKLPPQAQAPAVISVRGVGKRFGGLTALHQVGFVIEPGKIHALIGPNGAGKSTLVNVLSGFYRPDSGSIAIGDAPTSLRSLHHAASLGISRTFQTERLFGDMTVHDHVMVGCELWSRIPLAANLFRTPRYFRQERERRRVSDDLLALVGLTRFADTPASALAYGHRRLLEIARALAARPRLLLLDEPAAGLVASEIEDLATLIRTLSRTGLAIVLIEHHMDLVAAVSDVVTVLDHGEVIGHGSIETVRQDPRVVESYLGTDGSQEYDFAGG